MTELLPSSSAVADVLALRGQRGWLTPPLQPVASTGARLVLRAFGVSIERRESGAVFAPMYDVLSDRHTGELLLVAGALPLEGAMFGEILAIAARGAGFAAAAVDGVVRDIDTLATLGLPVYASATGIAGPQGRAHVASVGGVVYIGDVAVATGDFILLDEAGAVRVGGDETERDEVIVAALEYERAEGEVLAAMRAGEPLSTAYRHKAEAVARLRR